MECADTTRLLVFYMTWPDSARACFLRAAALSTCYNRLEREASGMTQSKMLISIFILLVIGLHALPVLLDRQHQVTWPFLMWSMYKDARPAGPIKGWKTRVTATTATGGTAMVNSDLVGLSGPTIGRMFLQPWIKGDTSAARLLLNRLNRGRSESFVQLQMTRETYTVSDSGLVRGDPPLLTYRLSSSAAK
jgi:hypothetical protein